MERITKIEREKFETQGRLNKIADNHIGLSTIKYLPRLSDISKDFIEYFKSIIVQEKKTAVPDRGIR